MSTVVIEDQIPGYFYPVMIVALILMVIIFAIIFYYSIQTDASMRER